MKIAVISSRVPYPLEKGDKLRLYHQLKYLSKRNKITLFALTRSPVPKEVLDELEGMGIIVKTYVYPPWKRYMGMMFNLFGTLPFQISFFYNRKIKRQMELDIRDLNPDMVYAQLIRTSEYVRHLPIPKVLDIMDAFSNIIRKRYQKASGLFKLIYHLEMNRTASYEHEIIQDFDEVTAISERDRDLISKDSSIAVVKNGIDTGFFSFINGANKEYELLFVGNLGYWPNIEAAAYIVNDILPRLLRTNSVRVHIAGARPDLSVRKLKSDRVFVTGWMDDIRMAYLSGQIFVAPIFSGAGLQNKILEAMAMGLPCITTPVVNEAIGAVHEREILIADNSEHFCHYIKKLLSDKAFYQKVKMNALVFIRARYTWEENNRKLEKILIRTARI